MSKAFIAVSILVMILGILLLYDFGNERLSIVQAGTVVELGERIYLANCAACHGEKGDGKGPESNRLKIKPRDFTTGNYKFRSTPSGSLPLDKDIFRSISRGVRTTSMLAQLHLTDKERWAVTEYLKSFSKRFTTEKPSGPISIPVAPAPSRDLSALGKTMYAEAGCSQCHGLVGKGDGPSAKELKDEAGISVVPSNLTLKPFKSGPLPEDLYRTITTGLNGTPMPSYGDVLAPKERWALVRYILSIATHERPRGMMGLVGEEVVGMQIDMRAAMAGMMGGRGMMGRSGGMMDRNMGDMMKDMMRR
ncbi:MAG: c-type cytochrome [Deltaproteobacteria bacterium]|nr:c-type cytochrome [Deltaproteobacteria bacterium]